MDEFSRLKSMYANIGKLITSSLEFNDILDGIMEEVRGFFKADNWSLLRLDPATNELFFVIAEGIDKSAVEHVRLGLGEGIAGIVAKSGKSVFVPDTSKDSRFTDKIDRVSGFRTKSIIAVPMVFQNTVYGVIEIVNRSRGNPFSDDEHLILQTIADFAAIAFANRSVYEQALRFANSDPLTGLYNRGKLDEILAVSKLSVRRARRTSDHTKYYIAVVVDIDNFKDVNDAHGHRMGDAVLKHVGNLLVSCIRNEDFSFRLGGDEFLVLIPCFTDIEVNKTTKRIEKKMKAVCRFQINEKIEGSFSYGISSGLKNQLRNIIHRADLLMYEKKNSRAE